VKAKTISNCPSIKTNVDHEVVTTPLRKLYQTNLLSGLWSAQSTVAIHGMSGGMG
jgi:hypothetical protein